MVKDGYARQNLQVKTSMYYLIEGICDFLIVRNSSEVTHDTMSILLTFKRFCLKVGVYTLESKS